MLTSTTAGEHQDARLDELVVRAMTAFRIIEPRPGRLNTTSTRTALPSDQAKVTPTIASTGPTHCAAPGAKTICVPARPSHGNADLVLPEHFQHRRAGQPGDIGGDR